MPIPSEPISLDNVLDTDSYKPSHWLQYPPRTTGLFSYLESRGGRDPYTVWFGLQHALRQGLGQRVTIAQVEAAATFLEAHGEPFNREGWLRIARDLGGRLPVRIRALPEGTPVPTSLPLLTVESTDPATFWIVSWIETQLVRLWFPTTVATNSHWLRRAIHAFLEETCEDPDGEILFRLHDFGSRGTSSRESASIGGAAHLVNFRGSDTLAGVRLANEVYHCPMAGFSIPAAEHSSFTSWGRDRELEAYRNMLRRFGGRDRTFAAVCDSYDLWAAIGMWGGPLRAELEASGARVVIRPDSGHPATVVAEALERLAGLFGHRVNRRGFKVLPDCVRLIQGDGIDRGSLLEILEVACHGHGFSAENLAFGMGGGLLQHDDRDTQRFAYKASWTRNDRGPVDVFKDPATDAGKRSKAGRLDTIRDADGNLRWVRLGEGEPAHPATAMATVFEDGELLMDTTLDEVRARAWDPADLARIEALDPLRDRIRPSAAAVR
jgi:nicotinamide phosphoribosyltransferase